MKFTIYARKCDKCFKGMNKGYCINGGEEYFCSEKCLHTKYSELEFKEMYGDGNNDTYFTEWDDLPETIEQEVEGIIDNIMRDESLGIIREALTFYYEQHATLYEVDK